MLFDKNNSKREEEQEKHNAGTYAILALREREFLLNYDHEQEEASEAKRDIQELVEDTELVGLANGFHVANGSKESEGDSRREPGYEQNQGPGVVVVEGVVELRDDGSTETHVAFEDAQHYATALGEVLNAGDEGTGVGEGLRIGADADVEAHVPHLRFGYSFGDGEPYHEVAEEVEEGPHGQNHPRRSDLVDEAGEDAHIAPEVFEEAEEVEGSLVIGQGGFDVAGVEAEHVGGAGGRHYKEGGEHHEPPSGDDLDEEAIGVHHFPHCNCHVCQSLSL